MQLTVRAVTPADAPSIAEIYAPIVESTTISFEETPPDAAEIARRVAASASTYPWLVAETSKGICGYAYASRHRERPCYRFSVDVSVYVAETERGKGVARTLYTRLFELLAAQNFHRAFAGIALPNEASVALHHSMNFKPVGVYHEVGYKFGNWVDVYWCERPL